MSRITLATLPAATAQAVFDQVATHLLMQNEQSIAEFTSAKGIDVDRCAYRGNDGLQCAAGCLIADEEYSPEFEQKPWNATSGVFPAAHRNLIHALQRVHDCYMPHEWPPQLRDVAADYNLDATVLGETA